MTLGVDIGGTQVRVGFIQENKIIKIETFKTNTEDFYDNLNKIKKIVDTEKVTLESIGICSPGPLDMKNGIMLETPNLKNWKNINIVNEFKNTFKVTNVKINNDANVAALGQFVVRQDLESLLYFTISTGIGSGFILDGKIYNGYSQTACEIANALPNSKSENPTKSGIEFLASGINIPKQLEKIGVKVDDAKDAFILYNSKTNKKVNDYFESLKEEYIKLFSTAIYFLNPQIIVLGGSVAMNNQEFFNDIFIKVIDVTKDINYKTKFEYAKDLDQATVLACSKL